MVGADPSSISLPRCISHAILAVLLPLMSTRDPAPKNGDATQLRLDVDGGLALEPGTAGLVVEVAVAGAARRDVAHRRAVHDDARRGFLGRAGTPGRRGRKE